MRQRRGWVEGLWVRGSERIVVGLGTVRGKRIGRAEAEETMLSLTAVRIGAVGTETERMREKGGAWMSFVLVQEVVVTVQMTHMIVVLRLLLLLRVGQEGRTRLLDVWRCLCSWARPAWTNELCKCEFFCVSCC